LVAFEGPETFAAEGVAFAFAGAAAVGSGAA
jgi:hypothetical protein